MDVERSAEATVEVGVDPATAFRVFTEEIDSWWVPGPINFFDSARATGMAVEPGRSAVVCSSCTATSRRW